MKSMLAVVAPVFICMSGYSQKSDANKVPQAVKNAFRKAHPYATASWEWEDASYEANFKENGKTMSCVIGKRGTILETESPITVAELPAVAKTYVNTHYKDQNGKKLQKL